MIIRCRINEEHMFDLLRWDAQSFNGNPCLELETTDLISVKQIFDNLNKIEIYYNDNLAATYVQFDGYNSIEFVALQFDSNRSAFFDVLRITLTQKNIVDIVDELDKTVNKKVDIEAMTASEYKEYITGIYSEQGQKDIFSGTNITLEDDTTPLFTYNFEDQLNLLSALQTIILAETTEIVIPYHSHHQPCSMYTGGDIVRIYMGLMINSIQIQTRVNMLNNWIRSLSTKEDMLEIKYDTDLPVEYEQQYGQIISNVLQLIENIKRRFFPEEYTQETELNESTETTETTDEVSGENIETEE